MSERKYQFERLTPIDNMDLDVYGEAIDYVFAHNLYERLGIREYNYFCKFYRKLCEKQKL